MYIVLSSTEPCGTLCLTFLCTDSNHYRAFTLIKKGKCYDEEYPVLHRSLKDKHRESSSSICAAQSTASGTNLPLHKIIFSTSKQVSREWHHDLFGFSG